MFPNRNARTVLCFALALALLALVSVGRADDQALAAYLERLESPELLVIHLEEQLERAARDEREPLIARIAELYVELLRTERDPARRVTYETRSRKLLEEAPTDLGQQLHLSLLQARYREAEQVLERHRLRLAGDDEVEESRETLMEMTPELEALSRSAGERAEQLQRTADRATGRDAAAVRERLRTARQVRQQAAFLFGWAVYYRNWIAPDERDEEQLRAAERSFAELLRTPTLNPRPSDVSVDYREDAAMARSILGMAMCKSLRSGPASALGWLELLDHPRTEESVRKQTPGWKLAVHLEYQEYREALELLGDLVDEDSSAEVPIAWLRLAALAALQAEPDRFGAGDLAALAVGQLSARGELEQVLDLAERFGIETLAGTGFLQRYLRGVLLHREAVAQERDDEAWSQTEHEEAYRAIAGELEAALRAADPETSAEMVAACHRLLGWARFELGEYRAAREQFLRAEEDLPREHAAEALQMAIVSLERMLRDQDDAELNAERATLVERYLETYPETEFASRLLVHRASRQEELSEEEIAALEDIERGDPAYVSARLQVTTALFRAYRQAGRDLRIDRAERFLDAARELGDHLLRNPERAEVSADRLLTLVRQVLEVALSERVSTPDAAQFAFELLHERALEPGDPEISRELECRRIQYELLRAGFADAVERAELLWQDDTRSVWSRQAVRAVFRAAYARWEEAISADRDELAEIALTFGGRVLREFDDQPDALARGTAHGVASVVAQLSYSLWRSRDDERRGRAALYLYQRLLEHHGNVRAYLRRAAVLSEALGDPDDALRHWRRIAAGSERGSNDWYEARFHVAQLLVRTDPERAREVLQQYEALHADQAPEPWAARFTELIDRFRAGDAGGDGGGDEHGQEEERDQDEGGSS